MTRKIIIVKCWNYRLTPCPMPATWNSSVLRLRNWVFPREVIEKILSYVDGKTLGTCEQVSPEFAAAVVYLTKKNIWKDCCFAEMQNGVLFHMMSKLYPHAEGFNQPKNWRMIYESWCLLNEIISNTDWHITALKLANRYTEVCDVHTHGNLVLVLLKYNKNFSKYYKVKTINNMYNDLDKSCRFNTNSLYITPMQDSEVSDDAVLLYCEHCKLIGIPVPPIEGNQSYPKIKCDSHSVTVEHFNGDLICFYNTSGLLGRSKCLSAVTDLHPDKKTNFIDVAHEYPRLQVSCEDVYREFYPLCFFHAAVTCTKSMAGLILLGTETGTMYGYFCKDKMDVLRLDLKKFIWRFDVCLDPILAIDVMVTENKFTIVCNSDKFVYMISTAS